MQDEFGNADFSDQPSVLNERQNLLIQQAYCLLHEAQDLIRTDAELDMVYTVLEDCADVLNQIEGSRVTEDVIEGIFSRFCVGK